jgi:hypothetical protein
VTKKIKQEAANAKLKNNIKELAKEAKVGSNC